MQRGLWGSVFVSIVLGGSFSSYASSASAIGHLDEEKLVGILPLVFAGLEHQLGAQMAAAEAALDGEASEETTNVSSEDNLEEGHRRSTFEKLATHLSTGVRFSFGNEQYQYGVDVRYSREVRYDDDADLYSRTETLILTPEVGWTGVTDWIQANVWPVVSISRSFRCVMRQTKFKTWVQAMFKHPWFYPLSRLPTTPEKALQMEPREEVTFSVGIATFWGLNFVDEIQSFPVSVTPGVLFGSDYYVTVHRNARTQGKRWILSVGGAIHREWQVRMTGDTPRIWIRKVPLLSMRWTPRLTGRRFLLRAGAFNLDDNGEATNLFDAVVHGTWQANDLKLLGGIFTFRLHKNITFPELEKIEDVSQFNRVLVAAENPKLKIPYSMSLTGFRGSSFFFKFLIVVDQHAWTLDKYDEETVVQRGGRKPNGEINLYHFYDSVTQRQHDRGVFGFSREGYELIITTVQDAETGDLYTEATYEIHDNRAQKDEMFAYQNDMRRFLTAPVLTKFPSCLEPVVDEESHVAVCEGLPDFAQVSKKPETVSLFLRMILGPKFHEAYMEQKDTPNPKIDRARLHLADVTEREVKKKSVNSSAEKVDAILESSLYKKPQRALRRLANLENDQRFESIRDLHEKIHDTIFHHSESLNDLIMRRGTQDLFAKFKFELKPRTKAELVTNPRVIYQGKTGDPRDVRVYRFLNALFETTDTIF